MQAHLLPRLSTAVGSRGNPLSPWDRANYVTTWWLFHCHKELTFCALRTNFVLSFDRYLVRHPTYPSRQAKPLSDPPLTLSYLSPFNAPYIGSERSTSTADKADKGGNNSFVSATALHRGKRGVKHQLRLRETCISHTRQETSFSVILLAPRTDVHGTLPPCIGPCCSTGHPGNITDRCPPLHLYSKARVFNETSV